ncbi:glycosyltransferase family 4 protein [Patescibacteria group bacterium]
MNILMINKFYFEKGGAERYFFDLKKMLENKSHNVIPLAMQHKENLKSEYTKYFVSEISTQPTWNIWQDLRTVGRFLWSWEARRKLQKLISKNKIDIAHIHNIYHQISPSILPVLKKNKIPVVMTVHDYALISANYNLYQLKKMNTKFVHKIICGFERFLHHKVLNVYKKNIDKFICPSQFVKNKLIQGGFDKSKLVVVPHFIDTQIHTDVNTNKRGQNDEKYILYFGRLSEEKGVQILIKAMQELPNVKLKIAGQGCFKPNLESEVLKLKLKNVEFLGFKNQTDLQKLILDSELVIIPSLAPETFGLSALETMALGKTVIASRVGALPELISNEFLFKPGDVKELVQKIKELVPYLLKKSEEPVLYLLKKSEEPVPYLLKKKEGHVPYLLKKGEGLTKKTEYARIKGYTNKVIVQEKYGQNKHFQQIQTIYHKFIKHC